MTPVVKGQGLPELDPVAEEVLPAKVASAFPERPVHGRGHLAPVEEVTALDGQRLEEIGQLGQPLPIPRRHHGAPWCEDGLHRRCAPEDGLEDRGQVGLERCDGHALAGSRHGRGHHLAQGHAAQVPVEVEEAGHDPRGGGGGESDLEGLPGGTEVHLHLPEIHLRPRVRPRQRGVGEEVVDPRGCPRGRGQQKAPSSGRGEEGLRHEGGAERRRGGIEGVSPGLQHGHGRLRRDRMPAGHRVAAGSAHRVRAGSPVVFSGDCRCQRNVGSSRGVGQSSFSVDAS